MSAKTPAERMRKYRAKRSLLRAIQHARNCGLSQDDIDFISSNKDQAIALLAYDRRYHEPEHAKKDVTHLEYIACPQFKALNP